MIAVAWVEAALAFEPCPVDAREVHVAVGADLTNWYPMVDERDPMRWVGLGTTRVDPDWSGFGWDQQVLAPVGVVPCGRVGFREQVVWHDTTWTEEPAPWSGTEWQLASSMMLGAETALPLRFAAGAYLMPGVRTVVSTQRMTVPERDLDVSGRRLSFVPTGYVYAVARFFPVKALGLHVDTQLPIVGIRKEIGWFPCRAVGAGVDVRIPSGPAQHRGRAAQDARSDRGALWRRDRGRLASHPDHG